jgi:hypothetical protein
MQKAGVAIPLFTSGAVAGEGEGAIKEAYGYIDLAAAFGCPYIRVLADKNAAPPKG